MSNEFAIWLYQRPTGDELNYPEMLVEPYLPSYSRSDVADQVVVPDLSENDSVEVWVRSPNGVLEGFVVSSTYTVDVSSLSKIYQIWIQDECPNILVDDPDLEVSADNADRELEDSQDVAKFFATDGMDDGDHRVVWVLDPGAIIPEKVDLYCTISHGGW